MRTAGLSLLLAGLGALAGCSARSDVEKSAARPAVPDWRRIVTPDDRRRLSEWRTAFVAALAEARAGGHGAAIDREGVLLMPDAALDDPLLSPGEYRCRVIKLGAQARAQPAYVSYPTFNCRVTSAARGVRLEKITGSQRPVGTAYPEDARRMIFLGSLELGDETVAMAYGHDPDRDMAGAVERIGSARWRLVLPYPKFESILDIVELVPAA